MNADPKRGERLYYARLTAEELAHARGKPFSDPQCGKYLSDFGALLQMLPAPPRRILDLGCGTGWTSLLLARAGYSVLGVDISVEAIQAARETAAAGGVNGAEFAIGDYEEMHFPPAFDHVLFYDALHHAENEAAAIAAAYRALAPGGSLLAFEPGVGHSRSRGAEHARATFEVHEKDMPPRYIWSLGRRAGFRRKVFLPAPHEAARSVYRRDYFRAPSGWRLRLENAWGYWRALTKVGRAGRSGMVVMWK